MRRRVILRFLWRTAVPVLISAVLAGFAADVRGIADARGAASPRGTAVPGGDQVTFRSTDPTVSAPIPATVLHPSGPGPFPAVVVLHGCDGISKDAVERAQWLQGQGYAVVMPESLSPRNLDTSCGTGGLKYDAQARDGMGALAYLRTRPDVVHNKIAVLGWSHGGAAALISSSTRFIDAVHPDVGGYEAAIALYPACGAFQDGPVAAPLLMLLGGADDWQPPAHCVERGTALQSAGAPVEFKVYPGATHSFDTPRRARTRNVPNIGLVHLAYDSAAAADAHTQVQRFLKAHLQ
jgi:dienelactone hydrolase